LRSHWETLYGDFIREALWLFVGAFEHELEDSDDLVNLWALMNTLRLFGAPRTVHQAELVPNRAGAAYFEANKE
jgi:hypothetical protein